MGAMGLCDDLLLLAPTRDAMQIMLDTCQRFAAKYNLMFSTDPNPDKSKTKSIFVCGRAVARQKPVNLTLDGKQLPWVESAVHLGHVLHQSGSMEKDIRSKRAGFIDESVHVRESFEFASPVEVLQAVKLYVGSHYGSMLWELGSDMARQYSNAWNTCVKLTWQVPRATHTYFVEQLLSCGHNSVRTDVLARYTRYTKGLKASPSMEVAVMFGVVQRDIRTVTGSNIALIRQETGMDPISSFPWKVKLKLADNMSRVPEMDMWRLDYLAKLLTKRGEASYRVEDSVVVRLTALIDSLCIN
jgi:hypothetical protein